MREYINYMVPEKCFKKYENVSLGITLEYKDYLGVLSIKYHVVQF